MDNRNALDPRNSVVVEACAGSGKTWLLVSRIVRLLLDGVKPAEILAITFTRRAAQEMQERLRDWLYELASADDEHAREFLRERAVPEHDIERLLPRARSLYQQFLLAQPGITISTFHGWFMQVLQRAPLNAGMAGGVQLVEKTGALWDEASQLFFADLQRHPDSETARSMLVLFEELGLGSAQNLLRKFADKRSEWWAYTSNPPSSAGGESAARGAKPAGGEGDLAYALESLRAELDVDMDADPISEACADATLQAAVHAFTKALATGTEAQSNKANAILIAWEVADAHLRYAALSQELYTLAGEPRSFKPTKKQDAETFLLAREVLFGKLQAVLAQLQAQKIYRTNLHGLRCGEALLNAYQNLKRQRQVLDFGDLEWRVRQLLNDSDHAEYLQYKLDSRYRHVLLDEFQDTNPLQWQILQSWFAASAAVQSPPTVFVVGDPKQSIYRFRRADARLFGVVREYLERDYGAVHLTQNMTRRNAPAVLDAVNALFDGLPEYPEFQTHGAHQKTLPGYVEVLPLAEQLPLPQAGEGRGEGLSDEELHLRNPLLTACPDKEEGARVQEGAQFAAKILDIVGRWQVQEMGGARAAQYSDIMVLVRRRTHLRVYEQALRAQRIPFLTSRRGGLLDTLEALDIQALLTFLITPFADLQLAHTLRAPIFACSDDDLMLVAGLRIEERGLERQDSGFRIKERGNTAAPLTQSSILNPQSSWWQRLQHLESPSPALQRAAELLNRWLMLADKLPVHDLLDRIYFEGDAQHRYAAAVPEVMRAAVSANLQAFIEIALNVDAGRYPSLPGFLRELAELRVADDNEAPDEGKVSQAGNAVRIYTVHEAKGLEAPIVWLLDTNAKPPADRGFDVLVDWPTSAQRPAHFSLYGDRASHGAAREHYFEQDARLAEREDLNLLYVAMTRAKQALLVSGSGARIEKMWYDRIASSVAEPGENPLLAAPPAVAAAHAPHTPVAVDERLTRPLPTGTRKVAISDAQRRGIWLHGLLQHLTASSDSPRPQAGQAATGQLAGVVDCLVVSSEGIGEREVLQQLGIPAEQLPALQQQAMQLLSLPHLARFFDAGQYRSASNELAYVNARGETRRIDRLVEFDDEVWVLDYKTGEVTDTAPYREQMQEYRSAMQAVYAGKTVRCALVFADGVLSEV